MRLGRVTMDLVDCMSESFSVPWSDGQSAFMIAWRYEFLVDFIEDITIL
jgi:hypothetical protein